MGESRWFATLKGRLRRAGRAGRAPAQASGRTLVRFRSAITVAASLTILVAVVATALWVAPNVAHGDESGPVAEATTGMPTAQQTKEVLEESSSEELAKGPETDPKVAEELPHRDLDGEEAQELAEGVFGAQLEEPAGIFDELEPERFLSDNAAIVPAGTLPGTPEQEDGEAAAGEPQSGLDPQQPVLIESTLPLRTENAEGKQEAVDLSLESPEGSGGELRPQNPLEGLSIPSHLGEGITLDGIGIEVVGVAQESTPTDVEEQYAFYPNVAEDTDLVVAPTSTGAETMTDIRSAEAPKATTYRLSLPSGATLKPGSEGGAEVVEGDKTTLLIPPPTATDAAGEPVPAEVRVSGDEMTVTISPGKSTQYPILVDPNYIVEYWCWSGCHEGFPGWSGSTTSFNSSYRPLSYAQWDPSHYGGLDLTSGFAGGASEGTHADWSYWVPRYARDVERYGSGSPPTTFVALWMAEGVLFLPSGNTSNYPAMVVGLIQLGTGWAPNAWVHYGGEGELSNWGNVLVNNPGSNPAIKGADENLVTYEYEAQAKYRNAFIGESTIEVVDVDAPKILELKSPSGWLTGSSAKIPYAFEDTGLGVRAASIRIPGETAAHPGWGANFPCTGTTAFPCPRKVGTGGEEINPLYFRPSELPTGLDQLEVTVADAIGGEGHVASGTVTAQIDNTGPEVTLSGALTEQETKGTRLSEYPLSIKATDGTAEAPQSGLSKVEVKVDGKKVTMPTESAWAPSCTTQNCSFSGSWILKASEYSVGPHEVEVVATDAVGNVSSSTVEVEIGEGTPQTSFTSPHPTYESHEIPTIAFKATREGKPVEGATFKCSLDGSSETPTTPCTSPFKLPGHLEPKKWHLLLVQAVDKSGKADPTPARWRFQTGDYPAAPANEKLVFPEVGKKTASYYTLEAEWGANPEGKAGQGVSGVSFEMELPGLVKNEKGEEVHKPFEPVPAACVIDGQGRQVSWPIPARSNPGHNAPVYLRVRGCPAFEKAGYPEKEILFRADFDGGEKVAGTSSPNATEFVYSHNATRVPTDAVEEVGPASVDLLTGAFTLSRTDVSIPVPGYEANLEFTRTYKSTQDGTTPGYSNVLGGAWQPSNPLESEFEGLAWSRIEERVIPHKNAVFGEECWNEEGETVSCPAQPFSCNSSFCERWEEEPEQPEERWVELLDNEGAGVPFEISPSGNLVAPEYAKELKLTREGGSLVLAYPNGTHTTFVQSGTESLAYVPEYISYQATPGSMRLLYKPEGKGLRLVEEIAPSPVECSDTYSRQTEGCRTLEFRYEEKLGTELLESIAYYGPSGNVGEAVLVAGYSYTEVANPEGGRGMELTGEGDPRVANDTETYGYAASPHTNLLTTLYPPGQQPWNLGYEYGTGAAPSRLKSVGRGGATTTIAYNVPVQGAGAPYEMGYASISKWGQSDLPVDATAIFPPTHVPSQYPPTSYTGAAVHYMDPEGHQVNVASPSPPGVSGQSIATTETDVKGNVVRELSPRGRLAALESPEPAPRSHELDTHFVYNANGTALLESWGPLHEVRLESGAVGPARRHTTIRYDEGEPTPPAGTPPAYLPTKETVAAVMPGREGELEPKVTETRYNWTLRKPEETIVDPGGLTIRSVTVYNGRGQVIETRQPKGVSGGTGGDTVMSYYGVGGCFGSSAPRRYLNLLCTEGPAARTSGSGRPELPEKWFAAYNNLGEPTDVIEHSAFNKELKAENARATETTYDAAGRLLTTQIKGNGGVEIPKSETTYNPTLLVPEKQRFVCEKECTGFNTRATTTTYNNLGQVTSYEDADGSKTETTYDSYGRPSTVKDGKGTDTFHYDEASGFLTSMEVSGVGTFTASYDADGNLIARGLPNGITEMTTYNAADEPVKLADTSPGTTWFEESLERSIEGRILTGTSSLLGTSTLQDGYSYDKDGRLTEAQETPKGGQCTSRAYTFDADSNRLTKTTTPGVGGACAKSGGTTQKYEYDEADRLMGSGITYDAWGRITNLPGEYVGGKELVTSYFSNDMVATQSEKGGVTNTFQLDATGRQHQREQAGGVAGVEVFHYDGPGDSPSWTALGSTWSRNVPGIGDELAAVQESSGTVTFKLTDLHGDVVASASSSPTATKLLGAYRFSEFGEPLSGSAGRFGWLGGKARRTELASGVIQMGARSYIPQLGRFLTPDPIREGSVNAYDYRTKTRSTFST